MPEEVWDVVGVPRCIITAEIRIQGSANRWGEIEIALTITGPTQSNPTPNSSLN